MRVATREWVHGLNGQCLPLRLECVRESRRDDTRRPIARCPGHDQSSAAEEQDAVRRPIVERGPGVLLGGVGRELKRAGHVGAKR